MILKDDNLPEILPCPFCGRPGELYQMYMGYIVGCGTDFDGGMKCQGQALSDRDCIFVNMLNSPEAAIEAWNTRAV